MNEAVFVKINGRKVNAVNFIANAIQKKIDRVESMKGEITVGYTSTYLEVITNKSTSSSEWVYFDVLDFDNSFERFMTSMKNRYYDLNYDASIRPRAKITSRFKHELVHDFIEHLIPSTKYHGEVNPCSLINRITYCDGTTVISDNVCKFNISGTVFYYQIYEKKPEGGTILRSIIDEIKNCAEDNYISLYKNYIFDI